MQRLIECWVTYNLKQSSVRIQRFGIRLNAYALEAFLVMPVLNGRWVTLLNDLSSHSNVTILVLWGLWTRSGNTLLGTLHTICRAGAPVRKERVFVPLIPPRVHFIGIGGVGMSGIARVLLDTGTAVSGSDLKKSVVTDQLQAKGAQVFYGHSPANIDNADVVVVSSAVPPDNVEVVAARRRGIPVIPRAEMLARLMRRQRGIAVAGAHGKTTTTAMVSLVLERTGLDPIIVIGGELPEIGGNAKAGKGEYLVAEADESDGSFLLLDPEIAVVTNVENDHLDYYRTVANIEETFRQFISRIPPAGVAILCGDDLFLNRLAAEAFVPVQTYGFNPDADYRLANPVLSGLNSEADVFLRGDFLGRLCLSVPGRHNLLNGLAAIAVGMRIGLRFDEVAQILQGFRGVKRRFQILGDVGGVRVVDDYAHHPTEIRATLAGARQTGPQRLIAVFQPHRYTRTLFLHKEFGAAFQDADVVIVNRIYSAGEKPIKGISAKLIADEIRDCSGKTPIELDTQEQIVSYLASVVRPGDLVITLGAGDIWKSGLALVKRLSGLGG